MASILSIYDSNYFWVSSEFTFIIMMSLVVGLLFPMYYSSNSFTQSLKCMIFSFIEILSSMKGLSFVLLPVFFFLMMVNLTSMVPYVFSPTAHIMITLSMSLPLWLSFILSSAFVSVSSTVKVLVPSGSPWAISVLLVGVELISIIARPFTLALRLCVNIAMGKLVMSLLYTNLLSVPFYMFELLVSVLQSYIFVVLLMNYCSYHPAMLFKSMIKS